MSKLAILIDGDQVTVHNLTAGTSTTASDTVAAPAAPTPPAVTSVIDEMMRLQTGKPIPAPPPPNPTYSTGPTSVREQITLSNGQHIDRDIPGEQTVYELTGKGTATQFHLKATKAGAVRLKLDGKNGRIGGGAAVGVGQRDAPINLGVTEELGAFDFTTRSLAVGEYATVSLRWDSGDDQAILQVTPV